LRILLVDDDPALRTLLRTTFEVADVDVVEADGADAARRSIRAVRPDVIVLDVNMPGTTGLELCEQLKADPATSDIPIILLTGSTGGTTAAAKRVGADAFVRKPFSPLDLLYAAIAGCLAVGIRDAARRTGVILAHRAGRSRGRFRFGRPGSRAGSDDHQERDRVARHRDERTAAALR